MSIEQLEKTIERLRKHHESSFLPPQTEELVQKAEQKLDVTFPPTFRHFLRALGSGDVSGVEFFGIVDARFDHGPPDAVSCTLEFRHETDLPRHLVVVFDHGDGTRFSMLDTSRRDSRGECPVVCFSHQGGVWRELHKEADDYAAFLHAQVESILDRDGHSRAPARDEPDFDDGDLEDDF